MQFSCCLEEVALFPEPIHSWPALRLLSQIKIVRGVALSHPGFGDCKLYLLGEGEGEHVLWLARMCQL